MAELEDRYEDNIVGKYFVDEQCIDCDLCREVASPDNFKRNEAEGYSYVYKQPETEEEEALCAEALVGLSCGGHWRFWLKDDQKKQQTTKDQMDKNRMVRQGVNRFWMAGAIPFYTC